RPEWSGPAERPSPSRLSHPRGGAAPSRAGRAAACTRVAQWRGQGHRVWTTQPLAGVGFQIGRGQGMDTKSWISAYAERLGTDVPTRDEFEAILALAAEAAHSSERIAAPVACWVAAKAGVGLDDALEAARWIDEGASPRPLGGAPPPRSQRRATARRASKRRATARAHKRDTK